MRVHRPFVFSIDRKQMPHPVGPPLTSMRRSAAAAAAAAGTIRGILDGSSKETCIHGPSCSLQQKCFGVKPSPRHLLSTEMYKVLQAATAADAVTHTPHSYAPHCGRSAHSDVHIAGCPTTDMHQRNSPAHVVYQPLEVADSARHPTLGERSRHLCQSDELCPAAAPSASYSWLEGPQTQPRLTFSRQQYLRSLNSDIFQPSSLAVSFNRAVWWQTW